MKVSEIFIDKQRELDTTYPDIGMREPERSDKIRMHRETTKKLNEEFKHALFAKYDVSNNPKREKAYNLAWEIGHSSGYREVEIWFIELAELIKESNEEVDKLINHMYKEGIIEGIRKYAWWKDGTQYVGTTGKTLEQAIKDVEKEVIEDRKYDNIS